MGLKPRYRETVQPAPLAGRRQDERHTNNTRSGISTVAAYAAHEFGQADKFDTLDAPLKSVEAARARADGTWRMVDRPLWLAGSDGAPASGGRVPKMSDEAHAQRRGWLKNGNPPGDVSTARRCGAKTRRRTACQGPAMRNGRCRMHGGLSTGPRTAAGLKRSRRANWKHGARSRAVRELQAKNRRCLRELKALLSQL
jgi:hypothetical protein